MDDLEPLVESPFESAPNRPFRALLVAGVALLGVVALLGRTPVTAALVGAYLLAIPAYVVVRARSQTGEEASGGTEAGEEANDGADEVES